MIFTDHEEFVAKFEFERRRLGMSGEFLGITMSPSDPRKYYLHVGDEILAETPAGILDAIRGTRTADDYLDTIRDKLPLTDTLYWHALRLGIPWIDFNVEPATATALPGAKVTISFGGTSASGAARQIIKAMQDSRSPVELRQIIRQRSLTHR